VPIFATDARHTAKQRINAREQTRWGKTTPPDTPIWGGTTRQFTGIARGCKQRKDYTYQ
jgi:hypothetical protein